MHACNPTDCSLSLQETYDTIPGQNKITFLLQAIRDASAAEEVCTHTYLHKQQLKLLFLPCPTFISWSGFHILLAFFFTS